MFGCLYLISTPIGNLGDITLRAIRLLKKADVIAAEDPARTKPLLEHYGIETPMTSYHNHNKEDKATVLVRRLQEGQNVALVVDAGTPAVSDPGAFLLAQVLEAGIRVAPIPGPSAVLVGLSVSGLPSDAFVFAGVLPEKPGARRRLLHALDREPRTLVFFESADRLRSVVETIRDLFGNRRLALAKDLTTSDEQVWRGTAQALLDAPIWPVEGEVTLVVAGHRRPPRTAGRRKSRNAR
ncbi:MAG TPA: 16S rRNA (cytidine(1402)-2'-O)-methyltransferase [Nitrospiraceae bacterium]|nr:16S rRNA (cytidine(1402)-2'-O)-methyltransferase [Nitrospiraceae bacterium]